MLLTHAPETSRAVYDRLVARLSHVRSVRFKMAGEETVDPWRVRLDRRKRRVALGGLHEVPLGWEAFSGGRPDVVPYGTARWFDPWVEIELLVRGQGMSLRLDPRTGLPVEYLNPSESNTYAYRKVRLVRFPPPARRRRRR